MANSYVASEAFVERNGDQQDNLKRSIEQNSSGVFLIAVIAILLGAGLAFFIGGLVTQIFAVAIAVGTVIGFVTGSTMMIAVTFGLIAAWFGAGFVAPALTSMVGDATDTSGLIARGVATAVSFGIVAIGLAVVAWLPLALVKRKVHFWNRHSRGIGSVLGLTQGTLAALSIVWISLSVSQADANQSDKQGNSAIGLLNGLTQGEGGQLQKLQQALGSIAADARTNPMGQFAESVNPVEDSTEAQVLAMTTKIEDIFKNPETRAAFVKHPEVVRIKQDKQLIKKLESYQDDPDVAKLVSKMKNNKDINANLVRELADSPGLLKAVDEKGLLETFKPQIEKLKTVMDEVLSDAEKAKTTQANLPQLSKVSP